MLEFTETESTVGSRYKRTSLLWLCETTMNDAENERLKGVEMG